MVDGYLKIKTKIDNKDIDKGIIELEDKIKKLQTDNSNLSKDQRALQEEINSYKKLHQEAESYKQKLKELNSSRQNLYTNNNGIIGLPDNNIYKFNEIGNQIKQIQIQYEIAQKEIDKQAPKIDKVYAKLDKVKTKQIENNTKIDQFKQKIDQINVNKAQKGIESIGKSIQNQVGKVSKMVMAVMSIRTAFGAVRSAISMVSQYNSQVLADFEYMRYCIANLIAPAVQGLIKLLYTALSYINAIMTAWFGINLFSNSSAKNFQKMQSSASGTAKSAKEIQKSLQGFDEMNILQDSSNNVSGGDAGGVSAPSIDLSSMQAEVPAWLKWIIDNKDLILSIMAGIAAGLLALKLGLGGIKALGIGLVVTGILYAIQALKAYLDDPTFTNLGKFIQGIGVAIIGLAIIIGNLPLAVVGAIVLIWGTIVKYWDQIKAFFQSGIDWLTSKSDWVHEMFGDTVGRIYDTVVSVLQSILNWFDNTFKGIKENFNQIIEFIKNVFTGNWKRSMGKCKEYI